MLFVIAFVFSRASAAFAEEAVVSFNYPVSPPHRSEHIDYSLDPKTEKFYVWVPPNYNRSISYGLIVYTAPGPVGGMPPGWADVLMRRQFLFVAPQNAGNGIPSARRTGLAVLAALEMMRAYRVDSQRVYAAGLSGGARNSGMVAFWQPDLFRGTIQCCGCDFYKAVAAQAATSSTDTNGHPYGVMDSTSSQEASVARSNVKFALITGSGDFRRGNILDIYNNGFKQEGFRAKLFDVAGMGHEDCNAHTLEEALDFLK